MSKSKKCLLIVWAIIIGLCIVGVLDDLSTSDSDKSSVASSDKQVTASRTNNKLVYEKWWEVAKPEDVLQEIKNGANLNERNPSSNRTILYMAIQHRMPEHVIKALVEAGADVNATTNLAQNTKETILYELIALGKLDLIKLLIDLGADVNYKDAAGVTPLMKAVARRRWEAIDMLIAAGADINAKDIRGHNVLAYTLENDSGMTKKLLDLGADISGAYH